MRLYLDEDSASSLLVRLLAEAGHEAHIPTDAGLVGLGDPVQLGYAIRTDRKLLIGNYGDFEELHNLIMQSEGHHPGLLIVRQDNDPRRDVTPRGIVTAIENLLAADVPLRDQFVILNHWR